MSNPTPRTGVLVTRPEPGNAETCAAITARGFAPVPASLFAIEPRPIGGLTGRPQAVIVTSAHALPSVNPATTPRLFAVGDATAARARALGITDVRSAGADATALLARCRADLKPAAGHLLLLSAEGQGLKLAAGLRAAGFRVIRRVVYAQRPAPALPEAAVQALRADTLASVLFMSGSASRAFTRLLPPCLHPTLGRVAALSISNEAAGPVSALPWHSVRVALRPTAEDVLALL